MALVIKALEDGLKPAGDDNWRDNHIRWGRLLFESRARKKGVTRLDYDFDSRIDPIIYANGWIIPNFLQIPTGSRLTSERVEKLRIG